MFRRTWRLARAASRRASLLAALCVLIQAAATLAGPAIVRYGIDHGVVPKDLAALNRAVVAVPRRDRHRSTSSAGSSILAVARIGEGFLRELRERVFAHLMRLSLEFYDRNRTGALVARMTADIESLQELVSQGLSMFIVNMLVFVGAIVVMVRDELAARARRARRRAGARQGVELVPARVERAPTSSCATASAAR